MLCLSHCRHEQDEDDDFFDFLSSFLLSTTRINRLLDLHKVFVGEFDKIRQVVVSQGSVDGVDQLVVAFRRGRPDLRNPLDASAGPGFWWYRPGCRYHNGHILRRCRSRFLVVGIAQQSGLESAAPVCPVGAWHRGGGHKRHYRYIAFKRNKHNIPARVA